MNDAAREAALLFVLTETLSCQFPTHFVPPRLSSYDASVQSMCLPPLLAD
ncbi:hypothetical protein AEBE7430_07965 [Aeromonas bestiarum]